MAGSTWKYVSSNDAEEIRRYLLTQGACEQRPVATEAWRVRLRDVTISYWAKGTVYSTASPSGDRTVATAWSHIDGRAGEAASRSRSGPSVPQWAAAPSGSASLLSALRSMGRAQGGGSTQGPQIPSANVRPIGGGSSLGHSVADELVALGATKVLVLAAELGRITELRCQMPQCLCPKELGGPEYFERATPELPDWMPTADHYPTLKMHGDRLTVDNVRLAHRLCNRVDYSRQIGRSYSRDLLRVEAARARAIRHRNLTR